MKCEPILIIGGERRKLLMVTDCERARRGCPTVRHLEIGHAGPRFAALAYRVPVEVQIDWQNGEDPARFWLAPMGVAPAAAGALVMVVKTCDRRNRRQAKRHGPFWMVTP